MTPDQRRVYDKVVSGPRGVVVGPLRAALHSPKLADSWQQLGAFLRYETSLPARFSELAILVTARRWNCQLEWSIHEAAARKAGLGDPVIEAIRWGRRPAFDDPDEAGIYEYSRQLQEAGQVSDEVYQRVRERWDVVGIVELTALLGYYAMVAMTLNAHQIPLPDGAEALLPPLPNDPCQEPVGEELLASNPAGCGSEKD